MLKLQHQRIGLLTGTFDPIHMGHLALAKAAMLQVSLDQVWLLVNSKRVNSLIEDKSGISPFRYRLAMAELAVAASPDIKVYKGELLDAPHNMDTFLSLMRHYPNYEFVFVAGMDTLARLDGWSDIQTVVDKASFAIARRPGASDESIAALKLRLGELGDHLDVRVFNFDDHASVASTRIRELLKLSKRPDSIDGNVYDYILQNHLYR